MRLADLRPQFRRGHPHWDGTDDFAQAVAIDFDCPGCSGTGHAHRIWAPFLNKGWNVGGAPSWSASGSGYHDLTFSDAPGHSRSIRVLSGCLSHFNVTNGAIEFYADSGHTQRRSPPVTETTSFEPAADPSVSEVKTEKPEPVIVAERPAGYGPTVFFSWLNGVLHQRHDNGHDIEPGKPPSVMVPVPGTATPPGLLAQIEQMVDAKIEAALKAAATKK